jgi:2',3'-cyclic-nucleotide 2'-phosphodiesterase (5'-nucleotidase family)
MRVWLARLVLALCVAACGSRSAAPESARPARPTLRLAALTDLSGYLEPCGCQSRPLGGIDKAAAKLEALRQDGVPLLFVAAGDLLFGERPPGAQDDAQAATQETWKAETLVDILNRLQLSAAAPGPRDLSYGAQTFERLASTAKFAWLPRGAQSTEKPERAAGWLGNVGGTKVGVVGISTFLGADVELASERLQSLTAQAQTAIDGLRAQGARLVLALISSDQRTGRRLSAGLRGLDFTLQGGLGEESAPAPSRAGQSTLLRAGRQGQALLVVDLYLDGSAAFADVSEWSRHEASKALQTRIADLSQRLAAWERDPAVDKASLGEQRGKLAELRGELAREATARIPKGNAFDARFEQLTSDQPGDKPIASVVDAYDARVNEHNRSALADVAPPPPQPGAAHYVGAAKCQSCHAAAYAWWTHQAHGHAYTTLETVHKQFNLSCVGCHVTGYAQPGGSTVVQNAGLTHVGCESCHGPGSLHVAGKISAITKLPSEQTCKQCHTPEHSDLFEYATYAARLRAPGHGQPAPPSTP